MLSQVNKDIHILNSSHLATVCYTSILVRPIQKVPVVPIGLLMWSCLKQNYLLPFDHLISFFNTSLIEHSGRSCNNTTCAAMWVVMLEA